MITRLRALIGLTIIGAGTIFACWALFSLVRFGSCGTTDAGVVLQQCEAGTGLKIVGSMVAIIGVIVGAIITGSSRAALAAWGVGFSGLGAMFLIAAFGPAAPPEASATFGILMGGLFLFMGIPGLLAAMSSGSTSLDTKANSDEFARRVAEMQAAQQRQDGPAPIVTANTPTDMPHFPPPGNGPGQPPR